MIKSNASLPKYYNIHNRPMRHVTLTSVTLGLQKLKTTSHTYPGIQLAGAAFSIRQFFLNSSGWRLKNKISFRKIKKLRFFKPRTRRRILMRLAQGSTYLGTDQTRAAYLSSSFWRLRFFALRGTKNNVCQRIASYRRFIYTPHIGLTPPRYQTKKTTKV